MAFAVRGAAAADATAVARLAAAHWDSVTVVNSAGVYDVCRLDGFVAVADGEIVGLLAYALEEGLHVVALGSARPRRGIGTALLAAAEEVAVRLGCARAWLTTTNDNLEALGFYRRRGYRLVELEPGAVDAARRLKPSIPAVAENGIPIRDELVLEKRFPAG
jgi:ribosomal protein S18 acetylase RimI-like enzyme